MFLTTDNKIKWRKMGLAALLVMLLVLLGVFFFDKPLFVLFRELDCKFFHILSAIFDDKVWFVATAVAAVIFCIKKCANTDCEFIVNRRKVGLISYVRNFLANTKNNNAFLIFYSVLTAGVLVKLLKIFIGRARPIFFEALDMTGFFPPSLDWAFNSMPSGHTAVSFAGLVMIGMLLPKYKPLTWGLAVLVGVSRIAVGAHWPSDVLLGAFIGMVVADVVKGLLLKK